MVGEIPLVPFFLKYFSIEYVFLFIKHRAGKKLSDPNTRICPTRKKPGVDTNFMSEFIIRTFGHCPNWNRVGSGFGNPGPGCPKPGWWFCHKMSQAFWGAWALTFALGLDRPNHKTKWKIENKSKKQMKIENKSHKLQIRNSKRKETLDFLPLPRLLGSSTALRVSGTLPSSTPPRLLCPPIHPLLRKRPSTNSLSLSAKLLPLKIDHRSMAEAKT